MPKFTADAKIHGLNDFREFAIFMLPHFYYI